MPEDIAIDPLNEVHRLPGQTTRYGRREAHGYH